tara:strand:+ start:777 stop:1166 length:390 start_codon:yes stop_codon:yes gene_type:complete
MASELRVNTLKDAAGNNSIAMSFVAGGATVCCAMIDLPNDFSGGANAVYGSINVSSYTDSSTGNGIAIPTNSFSSTTNRAVVTGAVGSNKLTAFITGSTVSQVSLQVTDADTDTEQDQVMIFTASGSLA